MKTFGLFSSKTLEMVSHTQEPWLEKRVGYKANEQGKEVIDEKSVERFYKQNGLNTEEAIMKYTANCIKRFR